MLRRLIGFNTFALLFLLVYAALMQPSAAQVPAKPGVHAAPSVVGLPGEVDECETLKSGPPVCATWRWTGTAYSAQWSNGAVGVLTPHIFNSCLVTIERTDVTGTFAGYHAYYAGKWIDGHIVDGTIGSGDSIYPLDRIGANRTWTVSNARGDVTPANAPVWNAPSTCKLELPKTAAAATKGAAVRLAPKIDPSMIANVIPKPDTANYQKTIADAVRNHQLRLCPDKCVISTAAITL